MDELLLALKNVSEQLVPIFGAVALIFLCIVLNKIAKLIEEITNIVKGLDPTLRLVDQSIEKVQAPLDTVVKFSHSLDKVHDKTSETLTRVAGAATENLNSLADNMNALKAKVADKTGGAAESFEAEPEVEVKSEG